MFPIGQTFMHRSQSLHFPSFFCNAGFPKSLAQDTSLFISKALVGQIFMHLKHTIDYDTLSEVKNLCKN